MNDEVRDAEWTDEGPEDPSYEEDVTPATPAEISEHQDDPGEGEEDAE